MENSFTFQQPKSQGNVLVLIFGSVAFLMVGLFLIFWILGNDSDWTFVWSMILMASVMVGVYKMVRTMPSHTFTMWVDEDYFTVKDEKKGTQRQFAWTDVAKYKSGHLDVSSVEKEYLWIWFKVQHPNLYIEVFESDAAKLEKFKEFRQLACHYLAKAAMEAPEESGSQG
jgi:hypothetical protein